MDHYRTSKNVRKKQLAELRGKTHRWLMGFGIAAFGLGVVGVGASMRVIWRLWRRPVDVQVKVQRPDANGSLVDEDITKHFHGIPGFHLGHQLNGTTQARTTLGFNLRLLDEAFQTRFKKWAYEGYHRSDTRDRLFHLHNAENYYAEKREGKILKIDVVYVSK